jgi:hypothetical protein
MKNAVNALNKVAFLLIAAALAAQQDSSPTTGALADLQSLSHGLYYQSGQEWKKLDTNSSSGFSTTHGASALAGVPPGVVRIYDSPQAANQFESRRPVFGIRVDVSRPDVPGFGARDLLIVRMATKKDHREVQVIEGGFASQRVGLNSKDVIAATLTSVADRTFILVSNKEMARGEYLLTFRGANGTAGYDFGTK